MGLDFDLYLHDLLYGKWFALVYCIGKIKENEHPQDDQSFLVGLFRAVA